MKFQLYISPGNTKIGRTPNLSMPPILSCRPGIPCSRICYALNSFVQYPDVVRRWTGNQMLWRSDPDAFRQMFQENMERRRNKKFFRWFVGGDIPDLSFLCFTVDAAYNFPETKFLVFTKRIDLLSTNRNVNPRNLTIIVSTWPQDLSYEPFRSGYPMSWFIPHGAQPEDRVPKNAFQCPGKCETCRKCWNAKVGDNIVFHEHGKTWRKTCS